MSDTQLLTDIDAAHETLRGQLRIAINNVKDEQRRFSALTDAHDRARQQGWQAQSRLAAATDQLQSAERESKQRLAYQFLNAESVGSDPIAAAKTAIAEAQADVDQAEDIQTALAAEIGRVQYELRALQRILWVVMAEFVVDSPEYQLLLKQHIEAFVRLRSIKLALKAVAAGLHGQLPQRLIDESIRMEPLDEAVGYAVNKEYLSAWSEAIAMLENDAETELPLFG